jgi:N-acetylmuramoyl-L-alanine amidase
VREIRYITIHETDNRSSGADSEAHNQLLVNDVTNSTGWHYTVDDHSIYHNLPDNEIGWNAGDNRTKLGGNINGIGIEMCVNLTNDFEQTLRNTAQLAAELMIAYDLDMDRIRFHEDFMNKECPHRLISEGRTDEFLEMIRDAYIRKKEAAGHAEDTETESGEE